MLIMLDALVTITMVLFFIHLTLSPGLLKGPPGCNMQPTNMAAHFAANITTGT
jgi:hypothetical protein